MKLLYTSIFLVFGLACTHQSNDIPANNYNETSRQVIDSLKSLSDQFYKNNLPDNEFDGFLKEAIAVAKNSDNDEEVFNLYSLVARRYRKAGKFGEAIDVLQDALLIANKLNSDLLRANATHHIAVNFRRINDNAKALKLHVQALELAESANDTFLIHCSYNGVGNVYFSYKDYPRAIEYFHKSLQFLGEENPNVLGDAINSNLLGEAWLFMENTDSALYYLNRSFEANIKIDSDLGKAICHDGMGLVYQKTQDYTRAMEEHTRALAIYEKLNISFYKTMCLNNIGATYIEMKEFGLAETSLLKTFGIASEIGSKQFALEASIKLAQLYNELGNANRSYNYSLKAIAYKDSITEELQKQNTEAMNVLYKAEKQEREILILKQNAELTRYKMSRQRYMLFASASLAIIIMVLGYFAFRQRRLKNKLSEIGLEQKLLRAQLNPHFVFNSLSAVQNFIMQNDKKAASQYLVNFSRLMRSILLGSGEDFVLLENELEMLDDYLRLQQLRFQRKFDYFFELGETINPKTCLVPPMLVQPFVENAIEHGVRDIKDQGIIITRFSMQDNKLIIEVDDNGKGLKEQEETNKKKGHISMALKITRQRMQNLQTITKRACKFEIIDKNEFQALPGVLVRIEIPFLEEK